MAAGLDSGVLVVDKPAGRTSFAMVKAVRRLTGVKKVGHAGTLDPFATGLLLVCIGRPATRLIPFFMDGQKEYLATLELGRESTTQDPEGDITTSGNPEGLTSEIIEPVLEEFRGKILQTPPAFSALKHKGKPLYHYARRGMPVIKEAREVQIHQLEWLDRRSLIQVDNHLLKLKIRCGKGTYIRSLAADIGTALGCGAYLTALRRVGSGFFTIDQGVSGRAFYEDGAVQVIREALLSVEQVQNILQNSNEPYNVSCSN